MSSERYFSYYYGRECEQFTFYRIPKILITDPYFCGLSAEAKLLYGLMLDRMCLSQRNGWFDEQGRVFIVFPQKEIQRDIRVGKNTASRLVIALEDSGLIRRIHRGQGMPDLIYVMNFASGERPGEPEYDTDLPEELALAAGYDSSEEARIAFHGDTGAYAGESAVQDETTNKPALSEKKNIQISSSPKNSLASSKLHQGNGGANVEETGMQLREPGQPKIKSIGCLSTHQTVKSPNEESGRQAIDHACAPEQQEDSRSLKSKPQPSTGLKNKPQGRNLESKPLDSLWKTSGQRFKNQTSGLPQMGTENDTDRNIYNISSSFISKIPENTGCFENMRSGDYGESGIEIIRTGKNRTSITPMAGTKMNLRRDDFRDDFSGLDYSDGLSYTELLEAVKEEIDYDALVNDFSEAEVSIFPHLIAEMLYTCRNKTEIRVGQTTYNAEILRQRYLSLTIHDIRHILYMIQENHISPGNIRNYYIQMLYNAPVTTSAYYARRYDYEMNHMEAV